MMSNFERLSFSFASVSKFEFRFPFLQSLCFLCCWPPVKEAVYFLSFWCWRCTSIHAMTVRCSLFCVLIIVLLYIPALHTYQPAPSRFSLMKWSHAMYVSVSVRERERETDCVSEFVSMVLIKMCLGLTGTRRHVFLITKLCHAKH